MIAPYKIGRNERALANRYGDKFAHYGILCVRAEQLADRVKQDIFKLSIRPHKASTVTRDHIYFMENVNLLLNLALANLQTDKNTDYTVGQAVYQNRKLNETLRKEFDNV